MDYTTYTLILDGTEVGKVSGNERMGYGGEVTLYDKSQTVNFSRYSEIVSFAMDHNLTIQ